jgi:acyl-coenzyme A thioesterase PaaI-like protein
VTDPPRVPDHPFNAFTDDGSLLCHGCAAAGRCRFGIRDVRPEDDGTVRAAVACSSAFEGAPGMAHGGWIAAVLDEITGFLTILQAGFAVTASLHVDFKRPVPLDEALTLVARAESSDDGRWHVHGELRHAGSHAVLASADAVYVQRDARYFERGEPG